MSCMEVPFFGSEPGLQLGTTIIAHEYFDSKTMEASTPVCCSPTCTLIQATQVMCLHQTMRLGLVILGFSELLSTTFRACLCS